MPCKLTNPHMIIALTALNAQAQVQDFVYQLDTLEAGLDVVSTIAGKAHRLLKVALIGEGSTTLLPIEAFDGQPLSKSIQHLQKEWQAILEKEVDYGVATTYWWINSTDQRIKRQQATIAHLEQVIILSQQRLQRIEQHHSHQSYYALTLRQLRATLERHQHNLNTEQESFQRLLNRLELS